MYFHRMAYRTSGFTFMLQSEHRILNWGFVISLVRKEIYFPSAMSLYLPVLEISTHFYPQKTVATTTDVEPLAVNTATEVEPLREQAVTAAADAEPLAEESKISSTELHFKPGDGEHSVALVATLDKVKPVIQDYLYEALMQSKKRKDEGNSKVTHAVRLYLPPSVDDIWLGLWVSSAIGMQISKAKDTSEFTTLEAMLGKYLWEGLDSSQLRKEEKKKGVSMVTRGLGIVAEGADYVISLALQFDVGWGIFNTLFPKPE